MKKRTLITLTAALTASAFSACAHPGRTDKNRCILTGKRGKGIVIDKNMDVLKG